MNLDKNIIKEFLQESNNIEREYSDQAFVDAYKAWSFIINFKELSLSRLLEIHRLLMLRLNPGIGGIIRNVDVRVGGRMGADPSTIEKKLLRLIEWVPKTEEEIKKWHIEFETIHPFEDGNGRSGRILMNWQRALNNLPILVIHEGEEQWEYYQWFN